MCRWGWLISSRTRRGTLYTSPHPGPQLRRPTQAQGGPRKALDQAARSRTWESPPDCRDSKSVGCTGHAGCTGSTPPGWVCKRTVPNGDPAGAPGAHISARRLPAITAARSCAANHRVPRHHRGQLPQGGAAGPPRVGTEGELECRSPGSLGSHKAVRNVESSPLGG